jgi:hypothetical protein
VVSTRIPPKYGKYLIGKYKILPNNLLPVEWSRAIEGIIQEVINEKARQAA